MTAKRKPQKSADIHDLVAIQYVELGYQAMKSELQADPNTSEEDMRRLERVYAVLKQVARTERFR